MNSRTSRLGTDPTHRVLMRLALPATASLLINATYNVVDSLFVGRFVGTAGLAAVGLNFPLMIMLIAMGILVGVGGSAQISRRLGAGDPERANRAFGSSLLLIATLGGSVIAFGSLFSPFLVRVLGASDAVFPMAHRYFVIIVLGSPLLIANQALNNVVYAEGAGTVGFAALSISSIMNIVLDWLFIVRFGWGVGGAAWATVISQGVATAIMLGYFALPYSQLRLHVCMCRADMWETVRVGFSASVRTLSVVFMALVINRAAFRAQGDLGIAVASVVFRVVSIVVLPAFGINQAYLPVAAYNYGAGKHKRMVSATWQSILMALAICFTASIAISILSIPIAELFNNDEAFIATASRGFRRSFILTPFIIFNLVGAGLFQALGDARRSLLISLSRMVFFMLPLLVVLPRFFGLDGIWHSFPIGEFFSAAFATAVTLPHLMRLNGHGALDGSAATPLDSAEPVAKRA